MKNSERLMADLALDESGSVLSRALRQLQHRLGRRARNSKRLKQRKIVIDGMHFLHRAMDEFAVEARAKW